MPTTGAAVSATSLIEGSPLVGSGLARAGKALPQHLPELAQCHHVVHPAFHLDAEPQRFGVREFAVVDAADVELRTRVLAAAEQEAREVVARDRVGGIEFVRPRE